MKKVKRFLGVSFIIACIMLQSLSVFAAENNVIEMPTNQTQIIAEEQKSDPSALATASLETCDLGIGIASNGISITYTTRATSSASEIGIKNLVLKEKTLFGWKEIQIGGYSTNNYK